MSRWERCLPVGSQTVGFDGACGAVKWSVVPCQVPGAVQQRQQQREQSTAVSTEVEQRRNLSETLRALLDKSHLSPSSHLLLPLHGLCEERADALKNATKTV